MKGFKVSDDKKKKNCVVIATEAVVFNVKWVLPAFYAGLIVVMAIYGIAYVKDVYCLVMSAGSQTTDDMKVKALDAIDTVMVANLIKMIITGSYNSFVSKEHGKLNENVNSATLKTKISTSILVVSSIHMLKMMIEKGETTSQDLIKCVVIYVLFLLTVIVLGVLEHYHAKDELEKEKQEKKHEEKEISP